MPGAADSPHSAAAAFYDVDGTLVRTNVVHAFGYYAWNQATPWRSLRKTAKTLASVPFLWALDQYSRKTFNDFFYRYYEGQSEDRLRVLAEEMFEDVLRPAIFSGAADLIRESRRAGLRTVLVSGALDFTIEPLARHLGVDDVLANRMEWKGGIATGRLIPPALAGPNKAAVLRDYCRAHGLDLGESHAFSDSYSDLAMLAAVGRPTAVNPDARLRAVARSYDWPIVDLRRPAAASSSATTTKARAVQ
jgi:HAD superfamily hydrolase (TIGR01490 family)